jgi:hypothetical protein
MVPGANILDQLLGGFEIKPTGQVGATGGTGVSAEGMGQGLLFGDLLAQSMTDGAPGEEIISNLLFPSNDQPAAQDEALAGPTVERGSIVELVVPTEAVPANVERLIKVSPELQTLPTTKIPNADLTAIPTAAPANVEKLLDFAIANPVDPEALPQLATELKSGSFRILDAKIVEGRLELTAVAEGSTDEPVKISVPESILKETAVRLSQSNLAVPDRIMAGMPVDELLSRLNLKMLEVKIEPEVVTPKTPQTPVEVTIVAEQSGAEIALKGKIARQAIQVRSEQKNTVDMPRPRNLNGFGEAETKQAIASKTGIDVGADNLRRNANLHQFTLADRFGGDRAVMTNDNFALQSTFDNTLEPLKTSTESKIAPTVKMTIPEMNLKQFSAGGQTIMIKIEPEQLGPARLNLTLRNQVLTARVIVDTPMARMAIMNSLDQLTDQLSRAGIDVDRIDVTLSGDNAREQFLDRRSAWDHAQKTLRHDDEFDDGSEPKIIAPIMTARSNEYMGADRVNLLA